MNILAKLKKLPPRDFEHLVYDLLILKGLRNAHWRTPGSDEGRDIEGTFDAFDFSGQVRSERWYVECKRHSKTLDWPTVYAKIAYADVQSADYLLICTTASLSPQCKNQVGAYERARRMPRVRAWEGAWLEQMVADEPALLVKYRLTTAAKDRELGALPFLKALSKTAHQIYGESKKPTRSIELAAALAELAQYVWLTQCSVNRFTPWTWREMYIRG